MKGKPTKTTESIKETMITEITEIINQALTTKDIMATKVTMPTKAIMVKKIKIIKGVTMIIDFRLTPGPIIRIELIEIIISLVITEELDNINIVMRVKQVIIPNIRKTANTTKTLDLF